MILMGLVSLALFIGMPKLVENSTSFPLPTRIVWLASISSNMPLLSPLNSGPRDARRV